MQNPLLLFIPSTYNHKKQNSSRFFPQFEDLKKNDQKTGSFVFYQLFCQSFVPEAVTNPENTFYATKRFKCRTVHDPDTKKDGAAAVLSHKIVSGDDRDARVAEKNGKKYSLSQIGAFILGKNERNVW